MSYQALHLQDAIVHYLPVDFKSLRKARGVLRALNRNSLWPWEIFFNHVADTYEFHRWIFREDLSEAILNGDDDLVSRVEQEVTFHLPEFLFKDVQHGTKS